MIVAMTAFAFLQIVFEVAVSLADLDDGLLRLL